MILFCLKNIVTFCHLRINRSKHDLPVCGKIGLFAQGRIKAGADGAAAPGPPTKIGLSITTYYEQLSDFFINQLLYFKVEYELPIFIGLIYPV